MNQLDKKFPEEANHPAGYQPVVAYVSSNAPQAPPTDQPPAEHPIDPEIERLHKASVSQHPELHLSPGEYVISAVHRHPIGIISIWAIVGILILLFFSLLPFYAANHETIAKSLLLKESQLPSPAAMSIPFFLVTGLFVLGALIATKVYLGNRFYVTNESVIQHIQNSLFSTNEQIVNLRNIEDASYRQQGILQQVLNYGSIRLSTEGDETTYRFNYVANPRKETRIVVDAIEHAMGLSARWRKRPPTTNA